MHRPFLSIVIPCLNRHTLLVNCLTSLERRSLQQVEIIVVDDGSMPPLEEHISEYLGNGDLVYRQKNRGRAAALREGILRATGKYLMIMDSDDEFISDRVRALLGELSDLEAAHAIGIVYQCDDFESGCPIARLPDNLLVNLVAIRADLRISGDLKEVIETRLVKQSLYPDPGLERRVPTSYIWAGVADCGSVVTRAQSIVRHRYLPVGMTSNSRRLKRENPVGLVATYARLASLPHSCYSSSTYRFGRAVAAFSVLNMPPTGSQIAGMRSKIGTIQLLLAKLLGRITARIR